MDESSATGSAPRPSAPASTAPATIGQRLRAGRERAGLSVAAAAEKLHLDNKVIEALEADRFAELGASVYVRGHLRRYGDFVGEQGVELVNAYAARTESRPPPPDLTQLPHPERRSDPRRLVTPLAGLACALVLALAIWWVLAGSRSGVASVGTRAADTPASAAQLATAPPPPLAQPAAMHVTVALPAKPAGAVSNATSAANSGVPSADGGTDRRDAAQDAAPARPTRLKLELTGESWVEVYDSRGDRLYYDVASAGSVQSIEGRPPLRVVLGNAAGVSVQVDGQAREIPANAMSGEGARFVVNRSGSLSRSRQ